MFRPKMSQCILIISPLCLVLHHHHGYHGWLKSNARVFIARSLGFAIKRPSKNRTYSPQIPHSWWIISGENEKKTSESFTYHINSATKHHTVSGWRFYITILKNDGVRKNVKDDIPYMKWKLIQSCLKPPTRYSISSIRWEKKSYSAWNPIRIE